MAVKWETVQAGDVLWRASRTTMGHTSMKTTNLIAVKIVEIDHEKGFAMVSANGNPARHLSKVHVCRLRRNKPNTEMTITGSVRIVPRAKKS